MESRTPAKFKLDTWFWSTLMPPLPDKCPHCGAGIHITSSDAHGNTFGHCLKSCGWAFGRIQFDDR